MSQGFFSVGTVGNRCWFYCLPDETAEGPCTMQKLRKAFQKGYLNRSTLVWNGETVQSWTPVDKVPGLLRQLRVRDGRRRRSSTSTVSAESEIEEEEKTGVYRPLPPSIIEDRCTTSSSSSEDETGMGYSNQEDGGFSSGDGRGPLLKASKTSQAVGKLALKEMASLTLSMHFSGHPKQEPDLRKIRTTSFDLGVPSELSWRDSDTLPSRTPTITHTPTTATTMTATTSTTSGTATLIPRKSSSVMSVSKLADRVGVTRLGTTPSKETITLSVTEPSDKSRILDCPSPLTAANLVQSAADLSGSSLMKVTTPGASSTAAIVDPKDDMVRLGSLLEDTLNADDVLPEIRELEHAMDSSFPVSFGVDSSEEDEEIRFRDCTPLSTLSSTLGPGTLSVRLSSPSVTGVERGRISATVDEMTGSVSPITPLTVCSTPGAAVTTASAATAPAPPGKSPIVVMMRKKVMKKKIIRKVTKKKRRITKTKKKKRQIVSMRDSDKPLVSMRQHQSDSIVISPVKKRKESEKLKTRMLITGVSTPSMSEDEEGASDADDDIDVEILDDTDVEEEDVIGGDTDDDDTFSIGWLQRPKSATPGFDQESLDLGEADTNRFSHRSMGSASAISVSFVSSAEGKVVIDEEIIEDDLTTDTEHLYDMDVLKQGNSRSQSMDTDMTPTMEVGDTSASMWISEAYFDDSESSSGSS